MRHNDEDWEYDQHRQEQLDAKIAKADELLGRTKFGQGLKQVDWVQKYRSTDPWPEVSFSDGELDYRLPLWMKIAYGVVVMLVIAAIVWR